MMRITLHPLIAAMTVLAFGCGDKENGSGADGGSLAEELVRSQASTRVEVATLKPSAANLHFSLPGEIEGSRDAFLSAPLGGYVESVLVNEGDSVKQGTTLARVNTGIYVAQRDQARAQYNQADRELKRAKALGDAMSRARREAAETGFLAAEAALKTSEIQVARSLLLAPFDGVVAQLNLEVGEVAAPGAPLARLVNLSPVEVSVSVSDRDAVALKKGMPATVSTDARADAFNGTISFVSPVGDLKTRAFTVKIEVPNEASKLLPGMIARVNLKSVVAEQAIVVPQYVLVTKLNDVGVYVEKEGEAQWRSLKLGPIVGNQVIVEEGIGAGERVVVTGQRELADGDAIALARVGTCCSDGRVEFPKGAVAQ